MKNGGSAFPETMTDRDKNGNYDIYSYGGMTLRDYFAGQVLEGMMASTVDYSDPNRFGDKVYASTAEICYQLADAMLAEREKKE